jgi:hypothetical protein
LDVVPLLSTEQINESQKPGPGCITCLYYPNCAGVLVTRVKWWHACYALCR